MTTFNCGVCGQPFPSTRERTIHETNTHGTPNQRAGVAPRPTQQPSLFLGISILIVIAVVLGWILFGGSDDDAASSGLHVSRAQMSDDWPLTVEAGTLRCEASAVTIEVDGVTYWVNGIAGGRAEANGWVDVEAIWAADPDIPGMKINIGAILNPGLDLCDATAP
jgi:hypothetical protein